MGKRGLSDQQIERVLAVLQRRLQREHDGTLSRLAAELHVSQPALWQVMNRRTRPSYGTVEALAHLEGVPVESILHAPRERAAQLAREGGIPAAAIAQVLAEDAPPGDERPVLWWIDRMRLVAQTLPTAGRDTDPPPASSARPAGRPRRAS